MPNILLCCSGSVATIKVLILRFRRKLERELHPESRCLSLWRGSVLRKVTGWFRAQLCQSWTSRRSAVSALWSLRTRATSCPLSQLLVLRVRRSSWTPTSGRDGKAAGTRSFISSSENGRTLPSWRPALPTPWPSWPMAWLTISCRPPWGWGYLLLDYLSFEKV